MALVGIHVTRKEICDRGFQVQQFKILKALTSAAKSFLIRGFHLAAF